MSLARHDDGWPSASWEELLPVIVWMCLAIAIDVEEQGTDFPSEITIVFDCCTTRGNFCKIRHQCSPVSSTKRTRVHRIPTGRCGQADVRCHPAERCDKASNTDSTSRRSVLWTFETLVVYGSIQENHRLHQICRCLNRVNNTLRSYPR